MIERDALYCSFFFLFEHTEVEYLELFVVGFEGERERDIRASDFRSLALPIIDLCSIHSFSRQTFDCVTMEFNH